MTLVQPAILCSHDSCRKICRCPPFVQLVSIDIYVQLTASPCLELNMRTEKRPCVSTPNFQTMASPHALLPMRHAENKAPTIIGVFAAMTALSILCAAARIYTRFRLLRTPGMDDLVIVLSVVGTLHKMKATL